MRAGEGSGKGNTDIGLIVATLFLETICDQLVEYGVQLFEQEDYIATITQGATSLGPVTVELRESTSDPRDKNAIITPAEVVGGDMSVSSLIKKIILGFIAGIILGCAYICGRYILLSRFVYAEEIEEYAGIPVVSKGKGERDYRELYSNLIFGNMELKTVHFMSLKSLKNMQGFIEGFAEVLNQMEKKVLVIEYVQQTVNDEETLQIIGKESYDYTQVCDLQVLRDGYIRDMLDSIKEQYNLALFATSGVDENPEAKSISKYTDATTIIVEKDTVKIKELYKQKVEFAEANISLSGVVFM